MTDPSEILVLVADNDAVSRERMAKIIEHSGYRVIQAIDGSAAMKVVEEHPVDIAIVEYRMGKISGFEFVKALKARRRSIPVVMVSEDPSTDLLIEAGKHEVKQVIRKPVEPERLTGILRRILRTEGKDVASFSVAKEKIFTPAEIMNRVIAMAQQNARARMGGPFAAIVTDSSGKILGEGVNSVTLRSDPTAHAEVMAIRRAAEVLGKPRLDGCIIYCCSEPTMLGQALIIGTGIKKVVYALSHAEVGATRASEEGILGEIAKPLDQRSVIYEQQGHDAALAVFREWQNQASRVAD